MPYFLSFYMESTAPEKTLKCIDITFDEEKMMDAFERMAQKEPVNGKVDLQIKVAPDYKDISVFIVKGEHREELDIKEAALQPLYLD